MKEIDTDNVSGWLLKNDVAETVRISKDGRPHAVMIPCEIFEAMHRNSRVAIRTDNLTEYEVEDIRNSRVPAASDQYNDELDD